MPLITTLKEGEGVLNPPTTSSSSDGVITAKFIPSYYGVWLKARFTGGPFIIEPVTVTFYRGDGVPIRGGEELLVLTSSSTRFEYAFDYELPIGTVQSWYVEFKTATGLTFTSKKATLILPKLNGNVAQPSTWIKSLEYPENSVNLMINSWPNINYESFNTLLKPINSKLPRSFGDLDSIGGVKASVTFIIETGSQEKKFLSIMNEGDFYISTSPQFKRPSFYATHTGTITRTDVAKMGISQKLYTVDLTEIPRPDFKAQPLRVPGISYEDRQRIFPTYGSKSNTYDYSLKKM